jgi:hypothetical protein
MAKLKGVSFFCIVHDLHSLRTGGKNKALIRKEIKNLSQFDRIIVHNIEMLSWLRENGFSKNATILESFDYLSDNFEIKNTGRTSEKLIVYAGNLVKSKFIYGLHQLKSCRFNIYGPGYQPNSQTESERIQWKGEYSPEQIAKELQGNFGLIWDGQHCDACDELLGNYLRFNAPHKFSLYIAAGLPVIAPTDSAVGHFIKASNIGFLVNSLYDLDRINISDDDYLAMKRNVFMLREKIIRGHFFTSALQQTEAALYIT